MINILGFVRNSNWDEMDAVHYYRCYLPLREVNKHDNGIAAMCITSEETEGKTDAELGGRDIYMHPRMHGDSEYLDAFIDEIHRQGGLYVFDSDDDLTEVYRLVSGRGMEFRHALSRADYVTCSTPALADLFAQYAQKPPVVLRNCVDVDWMVEVAAKSRRLVEGLTIGFSGSPTHWGDWYIPAVPFARIAREFKSADVVPILMGEVPRYLGFAAHEILTFAGVPYVIYPVILSQFDVILCAVDPDDGFNSGKSAVKPLESMAVGALPICSRFGPYVELADAGAPIVVVQENTRDGWYEAMRAVIQDEEMREYLRAQGVDWVKANRDMCTVGYKQWERFYRAIVTD